MELRPAQIKSFNQYQESNAFHPFTCGNDHPGDRNLVARKDGLYCPGCTYKQDWAHEWMLDGTWMSMSRPEVLLRAKGIEPKGKLLSKEDLEGKAPLKASVVDGKLVISISLEVLAFATFQAPYRDNGLPMTLIDNLEELGRDFCYELTNENEIGGSMLTDLFDRAAKEVYEQGSLGLDYDTKVNDKDCIQFGETK